MAGPMWIDALGYAGAVLTIATYAVGTMIPLRIVALCANLTFLVYSLVTRDYPTAAMDCVLIPLNTFRLVQMVRLTRQVKVSGEAGFSMDWLRPYARPMTVAAGTVLFHKGDPADAMFYIDSGRYRLMESGIELTHGNIVGELGLVAPDNARTQGLLCTAAGTLHRLSYADFRQLYFQNPTFGFYFLRLVGERLMRNARDAELRAETLVVEPGAWGAEAELEGQAS